MVLFIIKQRDKLRLSHNLCGRGTNTNKTGVPDLGFSPNTVSVLKSPQCMPSWAANSHHGQKKSAEIKVSVWIHTERFVSPTSFSSFPLDPFRALWHLYCHERRTHWFYRWRKNIGLHSNATPGISLMVANLCALLIIQQSKCSSALWLRHNVAEIRNNRRHAGACTFR